MDNKISIVIPCYQAEKYIKNCFYSLKNQTYSNLEFIFVDDGSTDSTLTKLKSLQKNHENIIVLHQKNAGVSSARNLGMKVAHGKYLMFVDIDDTLDKHFCERMLSFMLENDVELVGSKIEALVYQKRFIEDNNNYIFTKDQLESNFDYLYSNWYFHNACGKLYISSIAKQCSFLKNIRIGEDLLFNLQYFQYINKYALLDYYGYIYNTNLASAVHKYNKLDFETQKILQKESKSFYQKKFGKKYHGSAIDIVYINNIIDIVKVCMTLLNQEELKEAISLILNDSSLFEVFSKTNVTGKKRKFIQYNILHNHLLTLYIVGRINARRFR